jgi:hypothetical protein
MKTNDLEIILQAAKDLGHENIEVYYENGRDGYSDLIPIKGSLCQGGTQIVPEVYLVFKRG